MDKETKLKRRIDENLVDYKAKTLKLDSQAIFGKAEEIAAYTQAHQYMTKNHRYEPGELDDLLLFQNPLEVISNKYYEEFRCAENVLELIVAGECDRQDGLADYPMAKKHGESER
ncbi:Hypothetical protein DPCES_0046 [Desulfitobacterium hafniense]|uniref:Uncharacterized protein n=1 Tax=Desulfitobacterium hafniense TaxID=49338 RepID=A0A098AUD6_DESHA|nr:hypothetical protein [Desulfitobacterium hafniense]CDW99933.1 Hypothetical protein DPCES_0046 [Desulfitobacterium hafniense]